MHVFSKNNMIFKWVFPQKLAIFVIFNFFQKISILILHLTTLTANPLEIWGILLITPLLSTSKHTFGHYEIWPSGENLKNQGSIFFFAKLPREPRHGPLVRVLGPIFGPQRALSGPFHMGQWLGPRSPTRALLLSCWAQHFPPESLSQFFVR